MPRYTFFFSGRNRDGAAVVGSLQFLSRSITIDRRTMGKWRRRFSLAYGLPSCLLVPFRRPCVSRCWRWDWEGAVIVRRYTCFSHRNWDDIVAMVSPLWFPSRSVTVDRRTMRKGRRSAPCSRITAYNHLRFFSRSITIDRWTIEKGRRSATLSPVSLTHFQGVDHVGMGISFAFVWHDDLCDVCGKMGEKARRRQEEVGRRRNVLCRQKGLWSTERVH